MSAVLDVGCQMVVIMWPVAKFLEVPGLMLPGDANNYSTFVT